MVSCWGYQLHTDGEYGSPKTFSSFLSCTIHNPRYKMLRVDKMLKKKKKKAKSWEKEQPINPQVFIKCIKCTLEGEAY